MGTGDVSFCDMCKGGYFWDVSSHLCKILAWISDISETVVNVSKLEAGHLFGYSGATGAYGGSGICCAPKVVVGDGGGFGSGTFFHETFAGSYIAYHVGLLDHNIGGIAFYASAP